MNEAPKPPRPGIAIDQYEPDDSKPASGEMLEETLFIPVEFRWFPNLLERFGERRLDIAGLVVTELGRLGTGFSAMNLEFAFEGEQIAVASSVHRTTRTISVDVELASALETQVVGELPAEILEILAKGRNPEGVD